MANVIIAGTATGATPLPSANTIDATQDYIPIYTASASATRAINRNTYLGLSSQPLGLTDTQSPTNKTLGNTNTVTLKDTLFTLQDDGDTTKQLRLQLSGITTGTTRTLTVPDASDTIVGLTTSQTLTNKTLTSPTINSPTITNSTISADTVTGFTTSNNGTIYGMSVTGGILASAALVNTVNTAALQTNSVDGTKLATTAITLGYAQVTANQGSITTLVDLTSLSVTVTVPAGGRRIRITGYVAEWSTSVNDSTVQLQIREGSTTLTYGTQTLNRTDTPLGCLNVQYPVVATAGSHTYKLSAIRQAGTGTLTMAASSTSPAFILVEAI